MAQFTKEGIFCGESAGFHLHHEANLAGHTTVMHYFEILTIKAGGNQRWYDLQDMILQNIFNLCQLWVAKPMVQKIK